MPNVRLTACLWLRVCAACHECQSAEDNKYQLCFHDDFSPVIPLPAQVRTREIESVRCACDGHETRIPTGIFLHPSSRPRHHFVDWALMEKIEIVAHRCGAIAGFQPDRGTRWRLRRRMLDPRLRKRTASATDHALHLCESLLAGDPVIGAIRFTGPRQGSHGRLYRQPHVDQGFLGCCN